MTNRPTDLFVVNDGVLRDVSISESFGGFCPRHENWIGSLGASRKVQGGTCTQKFKAEKFRGEPGHKSSKQKSSRENLVTKVQSRKVQGGTWTQKFKAEKSKGKPGHKSLKEKSSRGNLNTKVQSRKVQGGTWTQKFKARSKMYKGELWVYDRERVVRGRTRTKDFNQEKGEFEHVTLEWGNYRKQVSGGTWAEKFHAEKSK